jgi:ArsR family transcriptional regulator, arsenate/arsenite/antimonite-responsive transcriptional repressor
MVEEKTQMNDEETNVQEIIKLAHLLKILSEPNRLMLLEKIFGGIQCNCELGQSLSLAPNLVSHHLSKLCESGLITAERDQNDARWVHYSINQESMIKLRDHFSQFTDPARIKAPRSICSPKNERELVSITSPN